MRDPHPDAYDLGYHDGQLGKPLWRQILKPQFMDQYDQGYSAGKRDARAQAVNKGKREPR